MKRAVVSVSNKTGVVDFCKGLVELGFEIVSTGGTAKTLREAGMEVTDVSQVTGFPECLEGRLKTLHPGVMGGILAKGTPAHAAKLQELHIEYVDLVVVNLYPFQSTVAKPGVTVEEAVENIDIGGPTMLRAAAKNRDRVTVIVDPADYKFVLGELEEHGDTCLKTRKRLARKVYVHTSGYDLAIAEAPVLWE